MKEASSGYFCETCESGLIAKPMFIFQCGCCGMKVYECCRNTGMTQYKLKDGILDNVKDNPSICFYCYHEPVMKPYRKSYELVEGDEEIFED